MIRSLVVVALCALVMAGFANSVEAAVAIDGSWSSVAGTGNSTLNHSAGSGSDRVIYVSINSEMNGSQSDPSPTYGGVAMTKIGSVQEAPGATGYNNYASMWYCDEACIGSAGSTTITPNYSATPLNDVIHAVTLTGVDQSSPIAASNTTSSTSDTISLNLANVAGDLAIYTVEFNDVGANSISPPGGFAEGAESDTTGTGFRAASGSSVNSGTLTVNPTNTGPASNRTTLLVVSFSQLSCVPSGSLSITSGQSLNGNPIDLTSITSEINAANVVYTVSDGTPGSPSTLTDDYAGKADQSQDFTGLNWQPVNSTDGSISWCTQTTATPSGTPMNNPGNPIPYIYLETSASGTNNPCSNGTTVGSENYLESPLLDATANNYTLNFDYAMQSVSGATLRVDVWNGSTWDDNVFPIATGDQGNGWLNTGDLDIAGAGYTSGNIRLRITVVVSATVNDDVGIDNIVLTATPKATTFFDSSVDGPASSVDTTGWPSPSTLTLTLNGDDATCGTPLAQAQDTFDYTACTETATVSADNPGVLGGATAITATLGGTGGSNAEVRWSIDGGAFSPWAASGAILTPPGGSTGNIVIEARATGNCGTVIDPTPVNTTYDTTCTETGTVSLNAVPDPITGATVVSATTGGGATGPEVSFDGGTSWTTSGTTYTPLSQTNSTEQFAARATGTCGSYVYDPANPITVNVDSRTLGVEANDATALQSGMTSILVTMSYCGDRDGDATFQVDYKLTSSGSWTNGTPTNDPTNDGTYTFLISGLVNGESYDVRMTYDDPDGFVTGTQVQTEVVTLVPWSDNSMLHNSNRFSGTVKHGGDWGKPGTYAGGITCGTCHNKASGNIKRVSDSISFPDGSTMPNGSTSTAISLQTAVDGGSDFGDDSTAPRGSSDKVCEACHTYDASQNNGVMQHAADQQVAAAHYDNSDCIKCHQHKVGFKADCTACHGNPPTVNTLGGPNGLDNSAVTGSATAGKHDLHVNTFAYSCDTCHTGWMNNGEMPKGGDINIGFDAFGDTTATYDGRAAGSYTAAAGTTVNSGGTLTCSAIYCHGTSTPAWLDTEPAMACGSCHGGADGSPSETAGDGDLSGATTGTKVGKHVKHVAKYNCNICHNGAGFGSANHVNGSNDISFSGAAAGTLYDFGTSTCSNVACHTTQVWDTATPALACDSCHGYPPDGTSPVAGASSGVDHSAANITAKHGECNTCHGKSLSNGQTDNTASGGDQYLDSYHMDGNIEMNGWASDSGQDAGYNQGTYGCARACHPDDASHRLSDSGLPVQLHRYGSGSCDGCHDGTGSGATTVTDASPHSFNDTGYTCEDCHTAHSSGTIEVPNNAAIGINYSANGESGISLGSAVATGNSEAEICWNCHDINGVSEWGTNTQAATGSSPYNYGNLTTSNWTTATWSSSRTQYAYKTGAIQSTHAANPSPSFRDGTEDTIQGSNYSYTESPDDVRDIRCSYCHDVHELAQAPGDSAAGKPYLRGTWMGNPYEEDGAPRQSYANTTYFPNYNFPGRTYGWGAVPRGSTNQAKLGGYWIDQNNVRPMTASTSGNGTAARNPTSGWSGPDVFAGLCALCHGGGNASWTATEIDNIDQKAGESLWMGTNGHANSVKGGTGASSANSNNIFTARNGTTTSSSYNPRQHWNGISQPGDNGRAFRASSYGERYQPYFSSSRAYGYNQDEWVVDETGATKENQYHKFSCSKCHNPHASRLPKLMITNCLDTVHNTWDNQFQMASVGTENTNRELAQWTSAQNCHRYSQSNNPNNASPEYRASRQASNSGAGAGWNKVTPWYQTNSTP